MSVLETMFFVEGYLRQHCIKRVMPTELPCQLVHQTAWTVMQVPVQSPPMLPSTQPFLQAMQSEGFPACTIVSTALETFVEFYDESFVAGDFGTFCRSVGGVDVGGSEQIDTSMLYSPWLRPPRLCTPRSADRPSQRTSRVVRDANTGNIS